MRLKLNKLIVLALALISLFLFTGCVAVNVGQDITVNKDGSTSSIIRISYDKSIENFFPEGILPLAIKNEKFTFTKTTKDNLLIEEAELKIKKLSTKEKLYIALGGSLKERNNFQNDYLKIDINEKSSFFKNKYTITAQPKMDLYNMISTSVDHEIGKLGANGFINFIGSNLKETIGAVPYSLKLSLPVKVTDSNATTRINEKTVLWDYTVKDLNESTILSFSFETLNFKNLGISLLLLIALLIVTIIFIKKKRPN